MGTTGRPIAIGGPRVKVKVTQNDIDWAVRDDSSRCMVARAIAREVDDAHRIEVDTQTIRFSNSNGRYAYLTPLQVQRYVAAFDAGDPIEPFEFTIRSPMQLKQRLLTPEERAANRVKVLTESKDAPRKRVQGKTSKAGRAAPPRVFKTRQRTYGHRVLRINQPQAATALDERDSA